MHILFELCCACVFDFLFDQAGVRSERSRDSSRDGKAGPMVLLYSALLPRAGEFAVRIDAMLMNSVVSGKQLC